LDRRRGAIAVNNTVSGNNPDRRRDEIIDKEKKKRAD